MLESVSICIVPWNSLEWMGHFLAEVNHTTQYSHQILISDNSDEEQRPVTPFQGKYWWNEGNIGYEAALNRAIETAQTDLIVVCNIDIDLDVGWLSQMVADYQAGDWAILVPRLAGKGIQKKKGVTETTNVPSLTLWLTSKSRLYDKVGLYEDMGPGEVNCDDIDMCQRAWLQNLRVGICNQVIIKHYRSSIVRNQLEKKEYIDKIKRAKNRLKTKFGHGRLKRRP